MLLFRLRGRGGDCILPGVFVDHPRAFIGSQLIPAFRVLSLLTTYKDEACFDFAVLAPYNRVTSPAPLRLAEPNEYDLSICHPAIISRFTLQTPYNITTEVLKYICLLIIYEYGGQSLTAHHI